MHRSLLELWALGERVLLLPVVEAEVGFTGALHHVDVAYDHT